MIGYSVLSSVVLTPGSLAAITSFPRGDGFYFSLVKLGALLLVYLAWVRTASWVDDDARAQELPVVFWNTVTWGAGVLGILVVWALPMFWISFLALLALYLTSSLIYAFVRNQKVAASERVLTGKHFRDLAQRYLKIKLGKGDDEDEREAPVLQFRGKSSQGDDEDQERVARAASSKGYRTATAMVYDAIMMRATDIHMEPKREEMTVRVRVDGILRPGKSFSRPMGDAVINIFKVLSNMDITEKRKPQDGSFSAEVLEGKKRMVDFRVATAGSVVGEKLVMRILDQSKQLLSLTQLGMRDKLYHTIQQTVGQPHGMFIVCGPTGSGKSTTLYACLNEIDRFQRNVITVENPVEYNVPNVTQIEINPKAGKTFASELRSILRQDPDVILVGEIRDQETAEVACQAAQTGHMVFTTLHANDAVTAVVRLIDLGVQPASIASAVSGVLNQRLVRQLCPDCKVRYKPNPEMVRKANLPADKIKFFYRPPETPEERPAEEDEDGAPEPCSSCNGTGYRGRTGVFELLLVTDPIRELIRQNPSPNAIKQEAVKNGMKFLQEDGIRLVIEGKTSIQELLRVCK